MTTIRLPQGFRASGVHCGIKSDPQKEDLSLIVSDAPVVAAGVYTQNQVVAAAVRLNRDRTPTDSIRAVVINSGNANACTGEQGDKDARQTARWAAAACGAREDQVLVLSTGIIGETLPMERISAGIQAAAERLGSDSESLATAARGMMTTDTVPKLAYRPFSTDGISLHLTGLAKGAAMIGPNMATMLAVVLTDAALLPDEAQRLLSLAVDVSFNSVSVDGHMSTNDTVLLLASGVDHQPLSGPGLDAFRSALDETCQALAQAIVTDGEGATHRITIDVTGCASRQDAHSIAKTVANSPLVKTAVAGSDPNWGRIVSAAGYAGVPFKPDGVRLCMNDFLLYEKGVPCDYDQAAVAQTIQANRDTHIELHFSEGEYASRFWTTDLTTEYVRMNAEYHT